MAAESERRRDDLAALRIDRSAPAARERPKWWGPAWVGGASALFVLLLFVAWRATLGRVAEVDVAYAQASGQGGAATAAAVLTGTGYVVTGDRYISLGVRVPGRIEAYLVEEGQRVVKGQPLVRLDARPFRAALAESRAALAEARAQVALAEKELARQEELRAHDVASQAAYDVKKTQLDVARATVDRLEARVKQLELDLDDTVLRAPTGGIVLEKLKEVSEIAVPGGFAGSGELIRIANTDELRAELDINESDLSKVKQDQPAEIAPDAYPDRRYAARVVKLYPQINRQKGTLKVEVRILEPDEWLRPDMSVRVTFFAGEPAAGGTAAPQVLAPREAVRHDDQGDYAWVVTEGRLRRQALTTTGAAADGRVVVSRGLAGGEALVMGEAADLSEGQRVHASAPAR
ncbi:MAG TPA: efflux RND transporter periplasmic adaptor subunit [Myxococcota bacterium]|nr:efflux RND transporter periplasmic adaptor subunit [Myxococcota bacterium]